MTLRDELTTYVRERFRSAWSITEKDKVPSDDDAIGLGNVGVRIEATVLYADLTDSTGLVKRQSPEFAAEVYKSYVYAAAKAIRHHDGAVTAYDGDRVMGVFMGGTMRNDAVETAFHVSAIVEDIIQPQLDEFYGDSHFTVRQKIGIDQSTVLVANTGIRGNNDYVWVGTAANTAAKLAALKYGYSTYASHAVYTYLKDYNLNATSDGKALWTDLGSSEVGIQVHGANARKVNI